MQPLHPDRQDERITILNAIECPIEEGQDNPGGRRHLADALVAMAAITRLDAPAVIDITRHLDTLCYRVGQPRGDRYSDLPIPCELPAQVGGGDQTQG